MHRIHDFIITDKAEIASMLRPFDSSLTKLEKMLPSLLCLPLLVRQAGA